MTDPPSESIYTSVVSLRGLRIVLFLAELNGLETWCMDVGNAYLEAHMEEKVHIVAGPEFREQEGRTLVIQKALYGLRSSGRMWWLRSNDILKELGFQASKAEPDIWMRPKKPLRVYCSICGRFRHCINETRDDYRGVNAEI